MNIMITGEEYNEYAAQKEKIKELEAHNEFLREKFDDLYEENVERIKKCDTLEEQVDHWKMQFESTYENYQQAVSEKAALIDERNNLRIKNNELENRVIRFKELVTENYRLKMSNNDLKENNKELKAKIKELSESLIKERNVYKDLHMQQIIKCGKALYEANELRKELEDIKAKIKEPIASITINPCRDSEETYSPDNNTVIKIENLYFTNNYISEEDEDDE